jgi:hypothetical protein
MTKEAECCPKFDPKPWDGKSFEWKNKKFVKDKVFCLFYIPLNFGQVMAKLMGKVDNGAMCLSDQTSMWSMDVYIEVNQEIEGMNNVTLNGKYVSKVYEGEFKDVGKWMTDFKKNNKVEKVYMWYTTCPACAKKWGKNYVVAVGEIR